MCGHESGYFGETSTGKETIRSQKTVLRVVASACCVVHCDDPQIMRHSLSLKRAWLRHSLSTVYPSAVYARSVSVPVLMKSYKTAIWLGDRQTRLSCRSAKFAHLNYGRRPKSSSQDVVASCPGRSSARPRMLYFYYELESASSIGVRITAGDPELA